MIGMAANGLGSGVFLGEVTEVSDPESQGRVRVKYPLNVSEDEIQTEEMAMVAVPFAGAEYGAYTLPNTGDIVVLSFLSGDARSPVVLGSVWANGNAPIETPGGDQMDRWVIKGRQGTTIAIREAESPMVEIVTPGGNTLTLSDDGTRITLSAADGASTIEMDSSGITMTAPQVEITASGGMTVTSGQVSMNTAMCDVSGVVKGAVGQLTTVLATTYTPSAGNML